MTELTFGSPKPLKPLKSSKTWAREGIKVQYTDLAIPRSDRETVISFMETGEAEISTMITRWQKRLESDGVVPQSIQVCGGEKGAEFRWYIVPRSWVRAPQKPKRKEKE